MSQGLSILLVNSHLAPWRRRPACRRLLRQCCVIKENLDNKKPRQNLSDFGCCLPPPSGGGSIWRLNHTSRLQPACKYCFLNHAALAVLRRPFSTDCQWFVKSCGTDR